MERSLSGWRGFTLMELLVVVAIIALLAAFLLPVFAFAREKGRQAVCTSNLHQIGAAFLMYAQDYDDTAPNAQWIGPEAFPPNWSFGRSSRDLLEPYVKNTDVFVCPSDTELASLPLRSSTQLFGLSYQYNGNPLGNGNNIVKRVYFNDSTGKPMKQPSGSRPLSWQAAVGQASSPVEGIALVEVTDPTANWVFADAWPSVHGGETTSYFVGTRTLMLTNENRPFRRACNLIYADGHADFNSAVAAAWDTAPY